ncbi:DUF3574 domain-containing protein [Asaia siamensis]|nr:DUF3574 domain-containing protein [Asaia siamensis]GBR07460.1 hypothetical protein AA0323_1809 [Asaia siamensis NRIC 0323]
MRSSRTAGAPALRSLALLALGGTLLAGMSGCAEVPHPPGVMMTASDFCTGTRGHPATFITLAFGLSIPGGGAVSAEQWADFLARVVTPRFPAGFSVIEAQGQWQNGTAAPVIREKSRLVWIAAPESREPDSKLDAIRDAYKKQFNQVSVAAFTQQGCASF